MTNLPKVSFIIPTLNRGKYVLRAVESCLAVATPSIDLEVVVLDSMSDDGSWEALTARYSTDPRVILAQNARGLGPTRSWLDGALLATGDYVTFLWSDDYISPRFLDCLLPSLRDGCDAAIGNGVVRDIDIDLPLPEAPQDIEHLDGEQLLGRYLGLCGGRQLPVSPAAALFARPVFDRWAKAVTNWCEAPGVRHSLMWRRAIGPDLMLFLAASGAVPARIMVTNVAVAQFSSHPGSITVSTSTWPLHAGYWLAKWWAVKDAIAQGRPSAATAAARLFLQGVALTTFGLIKRVSKGEDKKTLRHFASEVANVRRAYFATAGGARALPTLVTSSIGLASRMMKRALA